MRIAWLNGNMTIIPETDEDRLLLSNLYIALQQTKFGWPTEEKSQQAQPVQASVAE